MIGDALIEEKEYCLKNTDSFLYGYFIGGLRL